MVHLSETCETDELHLITHVETTEATVHEAQKTADIRKALLEKDLPPGLSIDTGWPAPFVLAARGEFTNNIGKARKIS
jgi:transposase